VVAFFFSIGVFEEICPDAEALDAAMEAVGNPSVRWHDASTTGVDALAAALEELTDGGGADEVGAVGALGAEAFEEDGLGSEGFDEDFGREGSSVEGLGF
jgi:hypothetical protein